MSSSLRLQHPPSYPPPSQQTDSQQQLHPSELRPQYQNSLPSRQPPYPKRSPSSAAWAEYTSQTTSGPSTPSSMSPPSYLASTSTPAQPRSDAYTTARLPALASSASTVGAASSAGSNSKRPTRDTKRRATHSQIERRRREKINDRLITLRNLVPACAREVELKRRTKEEEDGSTGAAAIDDESGVKGKRKRTRKKPAQSEAAKTKALDKDEELGLHKLEVLTHAIEYIYELRGRIEELETGTRTTLAPITTAASDAGDADEQDAEMDGDENESMAMSDFTPHSRSRTRMSTSTSGDAREAAPRNHPLAAMDLDENDPDRTEGEELDDRGLPSLSHIMSPPSRIMDHRPSQPHSLYDSFSGSTTASSNNSPMLMSVSHDSPLFSSAASTNSLGSAFTSPMMSLSSNSPLLAGMGGSAEASKPRSGRRNDGSWSGSCRSAPNALGGPASQRRPSYQNGVGSNLWPMLPAAALSLSSNSAAPQSDSSPTSASTRGGPNSPTLHPYARPSHAQAGTALGEGKSGSRGRIHLPNPAWSSSPPAHAQQVEHSETVGNKSRDGSESISTSPLTLAPLSAPLMGTFESTAPLDVDDKRFTTAAATRAACSGSMSGPLTTSTALALSSRPARSSNNSALSETPAAAAALLLSISTSPDAIRPTTTVYAPECTTFSFPTRRSNSRSNSFSATMSGNTAGQSPTTLTAAQTARPSNVRAEPAIASAPGGARARRESCAAERLGSPPALEL